MAEYDINAISAEIGKELFSDDPVVDAGGESSPANLPAVSSAPPTGTTPPAPVDEDKWRDMPKAWKAEKKAVWDRLMADKEAREYIHAREEDVVKGITQYSTGHKSWQELTSPFQNVLQQHPNVNPVQLMQNLMKNHLGILQATPEQKKVIALNLLKSYGIDLGNPAGAAPGGAQPPALPPELQQTIQTVGQLRDELGRFKAIEEKRSLDETVRVIEAFAKDPKNKYFDEVSDDIQHLIQTGAAATLEKAYEMACWTNPVVRAKVIADTSATPTPPKTPLNIEGSTGGTPSKKPAKFEDTIDAVMEKNYGPNWKLAH